MHLSFFLKIAIIFASVAILISTYYYSLKAPDILSSLKTAGKDRQSQDRTASPGDTYQDILKSPDIHLSSDGKLIYQQNRKMFKEKARKRVNINARISHRWKVVPDLTHFIWFFKPNTTFPFHNLISLLSVHKHIKPRAIIVWFNHLPVGKYWSEAQSRIPELITIHRNMPTTVYGNKVDVIQHRSDVARLEILLEFGGIYMDFDVVALRSFSPLQKFDFTLGYEQPSKFCNSVIISKPWAQFLKLWYQSYRTFRDSQWAVHSGAVPAQLADKHPSIIHTERDTLNYPSYFPKDLELLYGVNNFIWDWKNRSFAVHIWLNFRGKNDKKLIDSVSGIKTWNTTVGQIFRYVYFGTSDNILN